MLSVSEIGLFTFENRQCLCRFCRRLIDDRYYTKGRKREGPAVWARYGVLYYGVLVPGPLLFPRCSPTLCCVARTDGCDLFGRDTDAQQPLSHHRDENSQTESNRLEEWVGAINIDSDPLWNKTVYVCIYFNDVIYFGKLEEYLLF